MKFRFPIVIIDEDFRSENASGLGIRALADAIEKEGVEVLGVTSYHDLSQFAQQQSRASAFILSIDDEEFGLGSKKEIEDALQNLNNFVQEIRFKNADIPIYLYGETRTSRHIPNAILKELHGFIHMFEDTPEFVARHIIREAKSYLDSLAPPFFRALVHYAQGLAMKLALKGIRANTVSPGNTYFDGGIWQSIEKNNPALFAEALGMNPMGRMAKPEEIARGVVFLASPASSFTSGTNLVIDGALTKGVQL